MSEPELAAYQGSQGQTNDCGAYASAAAINMLTGSNLDGADVAALADIGWFVWLPGSGPTRLYPGGPILTGMQATLIEWVDSLAAWKGAPIPSFSAEATTGTPDQLIDYLSDPNTLVIVSMQWTSPKWTPPQWEGHAMVLVAYDPTYRDQSSLELTPWGFVNSHGEKPRLTWLSDVEFRSRWGQDTDLWFFDDFSMVVVTTL